MHISLASPQRLLRLAAACLFCVLALHAKVDAAALSAEARVTIERFLVTQAAGAPGTVTARVEDPTSSALPTCPVLQPFLPQGTAAWGRVSVGVRCAGERPWTRFLSAQVTVDGSYLVAAGAIQAGQALTAQDFAERRGDLTRLPKSVLTTPTQAMGLVAANAIAAGAPLRAELLRGAVVIQQGQPVRLTVEGAGFVVSTDARAVTNAMSGAAVQVKTVDGRMVSAIARPDGTAGIRN
jgi:flagella basal body P-ring formation protein FlgA